MMRAVLAVTLCCSLLGSSIASSSEGGPLSSSSSSSSSGSSSSSNKPPSAWDFVASRSDLSAVAGVLRHLGLDQALQAPFTATLLLPNNDAVATYLSQAKGPMNDTAVSNVFFSKLISYHTLLRWASSQLPNTTALSTKYIDPVSNTRHQVTFIANGTATARHPSSSKWHGKKHTLILRDVEYVVDEQDNYVAIASADHQVLGGGVVHIINGVLQPRDLFPSLEAALASTSLLNKARGIFYYVSSRGDVDLLQLLEATPGTVVLPDNAGFGPDPLTLKPEYLFKVLQYHFCPSPGNAAGLLYYPFPKRRPANSCLTFLGAVLKDPSLRLTFKSITNPPPTSPSMFVQYPTLASRQSAAGVRASRATGQANIIIPNIATPLHVLHVVDAMLVPPQP